ncbi:S8 family serine peptidase [bacterium]|nr:S8 family serine peptidase [bacterium]
MRFSTVLLISGALLTAVAGSVSAGTLTPGMETYLANKADPDPFHTLLILEDRVDIKALDWELHERRASFAERHYEVITTLQDHAARTQGSLLADLEVRRQLGEVDDYQAFWITNAVFVTSKSEDVIRELAARSDVDVAESPLVIELITPTTQEPAGDTRGIGIIPSLVNLGARRVWSDLRINGNGSIVANLDTGVDGNHVALRDRWRGNHAPPEECWLDFVGGFNDPPVDSQTHGTHTMGTICGLAPDDTIGVAPGAEWIAANTIVGGNLGNQVLATMQWLADPDGDPATSDEVPDVANNSWGVNENFGYPDCYSGWWDAIDACEAAGVMHVWSAGNEGPGASTVRSPADRATTPYDSFSVGSTLTGPPYSLAFDSSRGPAGPDCGPADNLIKPEVSAPGVGVYSSVPGNGYAYYSGTSMAAPHVAGAVALMRSANPDLDVITMKQILMDTVNDLGVPGEDNLFGHGIIDIYAAVEAAMSGYGVVDGTVVDDTTGEPIEGARVSVDTGSQTDVTDADGHFRLSLPEGTTTVLVSQFGYEDLAEVFEVPGGGELEPELRLVPQPSVVLSGTVYGPGESFPGAIPTSGAIVQLADTPLPSVTTDATGAWSITAPRDASYTVRASLSGSGACVVDLPATGDLVADLYLRAEASDGFESGTLDALAWDPSGAALWEATDVDAAEGSFSARSGELGGNETSILNLDVTLDEAGPMTFWIKTTGSGSLAFWDGFATIETWSGQSSWLQYTYQAPAGEHTFRWRYSTTSSGGGTGDRGYLDHVVLPGGEPAAPRVVPAPVPVAVEVPLAGSVEATLLITNQGVLDLDWTLAEELPYIAADQLSGTTAAGGFTAVGLTCEAADLPEGTHQFDLTLVSNDPDNATIDVPVVLEVGDTSTAVDELPGAVTLVGAIPNPFNPMTTVRYALPASQRVSLRVYDVQGRLVRELVDGIVPAGTNEARWDGRDRHGRSVASGTYFARLVAGGVSQVESMVLVR